MKRKSCLVLILVFALPLALFLIFPSGSVHAAVNYPTLFGIQHDDMKWDSSLREKAEDAGSNWVRQYVLWSDIQPNGPNDEQLGLYDSLLLDYKNRGLTVLAVIGGIPAWAGLNSYGPIYNMDDFTAFIQKLAERYNGTNAAIGSPVVNFFEFFNEPDLTTTTFAGVGWGYWSGGGSGVGGSASGYNYMLSRVRPVVQAANPNAMVVLGGLALEPQVPGFNWTSYTENFLTQLLANGVYFDVMNFHYYKVMAAHWSSYGRDILGKIAYVRSKLSPYGLTNMPIFATETGTWSLDNCGGYGVVSSEDIQAQYVTELFVRSLSADVKSVIWFTLQDYPYNPAWPCDCSRGLYWENGSEKPSFYAYNTASDLLGGATPQETIFDGSAGEGYREGYKFLGIGGRSIYALWKNNTVNSSISLSTPSSQVLKVGKGGNQLGLTSPTSVTIGPDPIYVIDPPSIYVEKSGHCGGKIICVNSLQNGIDSAQPFAFVEVSQETYNGNVILPKQLTIRGGWDVAFQTIQSSTVINGSLTISSGALLILGGVVLQ